MGPDLQNLTRARVLRRLIPFLGLLYFAAFIDRVNVGFAAQQMHRDIGLSAYAYGLGSGIFFLGYCLFEVPSNLLLHKVGGRRWIARIMLTWAVIGAATAFVRGPVGFCILRFLLGVAEAGFFPGVIYYLTYWIAPADRARVVGIFMTAVPISTALGAPLSAAILRLDGTWGVAGWRWLFLIETLPSLVLGCIALRYLVDTPAQATWLTSDQRNWLTRSLQERSASTACARQSSVLRCLANPRILALSLCYFGVESALYGVILWIPQIFANRGMGPAAAAVAVAIPYAVAAVAMVWWCRRSDLAKERVWHVAIAALVGFLGLAGSAAVPDSPLLSVLAVSIGAAGTLAVLPVFWTIPVSLLRGAAAAGAIALINAIGNLGGFAGPFVIGWVRDSTGSFTWGLVVVASGALLTGIMILAIGHGPEAQHAELTSVSSQTLNKPAEPSA